jgi:hypothetical protein
MSQVERSIQLQIQDIAAVKQAFSASLAQRSPDTLWWLVDNSEDIVYENRVKGATILAVDTNIDNVNIAYIYTDWFNLQNSYFSQDQPFSGISTLQAAIAQIYRWRVPQYFNDMATGGTTAQGVSPQYVFPYQEFNLGTYPVAGSFVKGDGPVDPTKTGPGILGVIPTGGPTTAAVTLSITAVYPVLSPPTTVSPPSPPPPPVPPPVVLSVTVPTASPEGVAVEVGGQALTAAYTPDTIGSISVAATTGFAAGYPAVIAENTPGSDTVLPIWKTEVAQVISIGSGTLVLAQQTPSGATSPPPHGLRNSYTTAAKVYPLFADVTAVTGGGTNALQIGFFPDWGGGFVDVKSVVIPQLEGQSREVTVGKATSSTTSEDDADSTSSLHPKSPVHAQSSKPSSSPPPPSLRPSR